jgi:hypothetical protein
MYAGRHVDVLVLDSLRRDADDLTHIGMPSALEIALHVRATQTLLVGMSHTVFAHKHISAKYSNTHTHTHKREKKNTAPVKEHYGYCRL